MIEMSLEDHDNQTIYCRMLGHEVPFAYCRQGAGGIPCRKIFDCWYHMFDIQAFMKEHFTEDQINHILSPPKPKMTTLIELIQQAQENAKKKGTDIDGWDTMNPIGDNFQQETKYHKDKIPGKPLDWASQPKPYKSYPDCPTIELPDISPLSDMTLHDALKDRKSTRDYKNKPLKKETLSYLLWASTGISRKQGGYEFRTAPSAGALYPIETYLTINRVKISILEYITTIYKTTILNY